MTSPATPKPWPANTVPTPGQLAGWLSRCTDEERAQFATHAIEADEAASRCFMRHRDDGVAALLDVKGKVVVLCGMNFGTAASQAVEFSKAGAALTIVLEGDASIEAVDDDQMRALGWVRA